MRDMSSECFYEKMKSIAINPIRFAIVLMMLLGNSYSFGGCMEGDIYYLTNTGLNKIGPNNQRSEIIKWSESSGVIIHGNALSMVDKCHVLLSREELHNEGRGREKIYLVDLNTGKMEFIRYGYRPVFLPDTGIMLFLDRRPGATYDQLFLAGLRNTATSAKQITQDENDSVLRTDAIFQISAGEVLVQHGVDKKKAKIFNLHRDTYREIKFPRSCSIMYWRPKYKQMLCYDTDERVIYTADLEFKSVSKINLSMQYEPIGYSEGRDELYLNKPTGRYYGDIFEFSGYKIYSGELTVYDNDLDLYLGGVVSY